jgi:TPR repeat protein
VRLFRLAAAQGFAPAQLNLGILYHKGEGVAQDYAEAARLWRLAAAQGVAEAQTGLAVLYAQGAGVSQDYVEAARLWRLAAAQGVAAAETQLAELASERAYVSVCCMGCGATRKLKACAKCKVARFCTAECQRRTWPEHKPHCKRWAAEAAGER